MPKKTRVLAIDPGTREIGVALLDDWELAEYGVKSLKNAKNHKELFILINRIISNLVRERKPDVMVLEKNVFSQIKSNLLLAMVVNRIKSIGKGRNMPVKEYNPRTIRKIVCNNGNATKKDLAKAIVVRYPELRIYLESDRKWKIRYWQNIFDAIAVGLAYLRRNNNF